ncbi:MAG TPA: protein translocase subunit SecD, partial [Chromatiales bacterium]|nr:protein translocase subunit SecD [Chromatiales bacterium]HEX21916.1 protein translocase subunit SecD [Chromatiales bacterium]
MNQYPAWKYLLVIIVLLLSSLYALPNLYGEDPALQVTSTRTAEVDLTTQDKVQKLLTDAGVT